MSTTDRLHQPCPTCAKRAWKAPLCEHCQHNFDAIRLLKEDYKELEKVAKRSKSKLVGMMISKQTEKDKWR